MQLFWKEAGIWFELRHENILPLLGAFHDDLGFHTVSPWMERGNLTDCLYQKQPFDHVHVVCTEPPS